MSLPLGAVAPDFEAETTEGRLKFHDWIGDSWAILFSHPKDFTPVCTTELGYLAKLKPEFDKRNTKIIGLSVDPVSNHEKWADDIRETQGQAPNYPMIGDGDLTISKLYGMLPASTSGSSEGRTPADNHTVRTVFVIGPDKKVKLSLAYPMTRRRKRTRMAGSLRNRTSGSFLSRSKKIGRRRSACGPSEARSRRASIEEGRAPAAREKKAKEKSRKADK